VHDVPLLDRSIPGQGKGGEALAETVLQSQTIQPTRSGNINPRQDQAHEAVRFVDFFFFKYLPWRGQRGRAAAARALCACCAAGYAKDCTAPPVLPVRF
jgi:hypothetical protein